MKKKEQLKQIIRDFHLSTDFDVKLRTLQPPKKKKKIITLIGVRRCGKSSILYHMINELCKRVDKTKILFLNLNQIQISNILQSVFQQPKKIMKKESSKEKLLKLLKNSTKKSIHIKNSLLN